MGGVVASSAAKIKIGALERRAIQPLVCPMGRCAVYKVGHLALASSLGDLYLKVAVRVRGPWIGV
jgi:hypothetical protein